MKYFEVIDSFDQEGRWHLSAPKTRTGIDLDPRLFTEGGSYRGEIYYPKSGLRVADFSIELPLRAHIKKGSIPLDFTFGPFNLPVVSARIAEHLEARCGQAVQLFPIRIDNLERHFEVVNVVEVIEAIDLLKSDIVWRLRPDPNGIERKTIAGISKLMLRTERINAPIFRLRDWELPLIVDESIKVLLQSLKVTGIRFSEIRTA